MTAIGPVDILAKNGTGETVAVELNAVATSTESNGCLGTWASKSGSAACARARNFAAQQIKPQARVLAEDRGFTTVTLDYDAMRGVDDADSRLF